MATSNSNISKTIKTEEVELANEDIGESVVETKHQVSLPEGSLITSTFNVNTNNTQGDVSKASTFAGGSNLDSWRLEAARLSVLPVTCKDTSAELHKNRLGSGSLGKCIKLDSSWHTPNQFQTLCGKGQCKDWKKSIRFRGIMLKTLIDEELLSLHSTSCLCAICTGDETATAPVRPFTPSPRLQQKLRWDHKSSDPTLLKRLENLENQIRRFASDSLKEIAELREAMSSQSDIFKREEDASGLAAQVADLQLDGSSQPALHDYNQKKCANCKKKAIVECSCCRRPYCSMACQLKYLASHPQHPSLKVPKPK